VLIFVSEEHLAILVLPGVSQGGAISKKGDWGNAHAARRMSDCRLSGGGMAVAAIIVGCVRG